MEPSPSWEAASCAATQKLPSILWNPWVHYRVHKNPPLVPTLSQIDSVNTTPSYPCKIHFNNVHSPTSWSSYLSPSFWLSHLTHSCYMPCPSHHPWLDHSNYTWRRVQVMKLLIMQFCRRKLSWSNMWEDLFIRISRSRRWVYEICPMRSPWSAGSGIEAFLSFFLLEVKWIREFLFSENKVIRKIAMKNI
jgi:hypothetical protein